MNMTTLAKVKDVMAASGAVDTSVDDTLNRLIAMVSTRAEQIMDRTVQSASDIVEYHDVEEADHGLFIVKATPVTAVAVVNASDRVWASGQTIDSEYVVNYGDKTGRVLVTVELMPGPQVVRLTYDGGMAADTDAFVAAFQDIAEALSFEVLNQWRSIPGLGISQVTTGVDTVRYRLVKFLPETMNTLLHHKRVTM